MYVIRYNSPANSTMRYLALSEIAPRWTHRLEEATTFRDLDALLPAVAGLSPGVFAIGSARARHEIVRLTPVIPAPTYTEEVVL